LIHQQKKFLLGEKNYIKIHHKPDIFDKLSPDWYIISLYFIAILGFFTYSKYIPSLKVIIGILFCFIISIICLYLIFNFGAIYYRDVALVFAPEKLLVRISADKFASIHKNEISKIYLKGSIMHIEYLKHDAKKNINAGYKSDLKDLLCSKRYLIKQIKKHLQISVI